MDSMTVPSAIVSVRAYFPVIRINGSVYWAVRLVQTTEDAYEADAGSHSHCFLCCLWFRRQTPLQFGRSDDRGVFIRMFTLRLGGVTVPATRSRIYF